MHAYNLFVHHTGIIGGVCGGICGVGLVAVFIAILCCIAGRKRRSRTQAVPDSKFISPDEFES